MTGMDNTERTWRSSRPRASLVQGRRDWYRIENRAKSADVYIYDEIGYFGVTAADFVRELQTLDVPEINLHLNTPGGDVFDGIAIHNAIKNHPATVNGVVDGLAASIGSVIALACDNLAIEKNARMMIHEAFALAIGNAADMKRMAARLDETSNIIAQMYADKSGTPVADWRAAMEAETWYTGQQAVDAGLADEVVNAGQERQSASFDLSIFRNAVEGAEDEDEAVEEAIATPEQDVTEHEATDSDPLAELRAEMESRDSEPIINPELEVALDRVLARAH
jgi:ATP-dependent protease ClpP protease subunit